MSYRSTVAFALTWALVWTGASRAASSLRVDINPDNGRNDARTKDWQDWRLGGKQQTFKADGVTVAFRPAGAKDLRADMWKGGYDTGATLASDGLVAQDSAFDPRHFLSGARSAYEMIVLAFANGDRRALKDLLSSEVYESFEAAIKERERQEQKTETRFVSIDKAEIVGAEARDRAAQLTVRFVSQMISVTRDKAGTIVDGNPDKVADITDVWTFARDTTSRDPNWKLVGTGSAH